MHELQRILKRQVRELARRVLGEPERPSLDRAPEANLSVRLCGHERMFSRQLSVANRVGRTDEGGKLCVTDCR
jgi:hypothetical protein